MTNLQERESVNASLTVRDGAKVEAGYCGVMALGLTSTVNIEGGEIVATYFAISGNGTTSGSNRGGTVINISGGTITSNEDVAIYHPQDGTLNISDGIITGYDGVQMKSGTVNITGGEIHAHGAHTENYDKGGASNSIGAALSLLSQGSATGSYAGGIEANITGGTLTSENGYAIVEVSAADASPKFGSLDIKGGTFTTNSDLSVISMNSATNDNTEITGGTYSTDLSNLKEAGVTVPEMTQDANGNYTAVTVPATDLSIDTSNLSEYIVGEELRLEVGQTLQLKVILTPADSNDVVVWTSSDESVATVSQSGLVRALKTGTVTITASITHPDAENAYMDEDLTITVVEAGSGGGGGCSAGFGALALLAAVPLLRMRKK